MSKHRPSAKARRSAARLSAVQALYQVMLINTDVERVIGEFVHFRFGAQIDGDEYVSPDPQLFADIVRGTAQRSRELEPMVADAMSNAWSLDRVELLLKVILKSGTWELLENPLISPGIIITEYVHVAQAFFGGKEPAMVNAVLDRLSRSIRPGEGANEAAAADLPPPMDTADLAIETISPESPDSDADQPRAEPASSSEGDNDDETGVQQENATDAPHGSNDRTN